jgi:hypothetical protein
MSQTYSLYDKATGIFPGTKLSCDDQYLQQNVPGGMSPIAGDYDDLSQRVDLATGAVINYQPPAPLNDTTQTWAWDVPTSRWVSVKTLAALQSDAWNRIKSARDAAIDAPLPTPYGTFDSYAEARNNISDAVLLAQTLTSVGQLVAIAYTLADNSVVTLNLAMIVTVGLLLGSKVQTARGTATGLRTLINAATTAQQLDAIVWPA